MSFISLLLATTPVITFLTVDPAVFPQAAGGDYWVWCVDRKRLKHFGDGLPAEVLAALRLCDEAKPEQFVIRHSQAVSYTPFPLLCLDMCQEPKQIASPHTPKLVAQVQMTATTFTPQRGSPGTSIRPDVAGRQPCRACSVDEPPRHHFCF